MGDLGLSEDHYLDGLYRGWEETWGRCSRQEGAGKVAWMGRWFSDGIVGWGWAGREWSWGGE